MQPIAKRTRHQREMDLMKRYWEWKKPRLTSVPANHNPAPPSSGSSSGSSTSASASVSASASPVSSEDGNEGTSRRDHGNVAESEVVSSSDSESSGEVEEESSESGSGSESEGETRSVDSGSRRKGESVDSGSKIESLGDRDRPIVIGGDVDDSDDVVDDDKRCQGKKKKKKNSDGDDDEEEESGIGRVVEKRGKIKSCSVESRSTKTPTHNTTPNRKMEKNLVVIDGDKDDDDEEEGESGLGRGVHEADESHSQSNRLFGDVEIDDCIEVDDVDDEKEESVVGRNDDDKEESGVGRKDDDKGESVVGRNDDEKEESVVGRKNDDEKEESGVGRNDVVVSGSGSGLNGFVDVCRGKKPINVEKEKEREQPMMPNRKVIKKGPLTINEIHRVLFNSIMDVDDEDLVEEPFSPKPHENEETIPSPDVSSQEESDSKKPEEETEVESIYKMMEFCLIGGESDAAAAADAFLEDEELLSDAKKSQKQLCKEGKHFLILDEEIGVICKSCGLVREEIRHVTAPFHSTLFGFSDRMHFPLYNHRDAGDLPNVEDPNSEDQLYKDDANFDPTGTVWEIIPGLRRTLLPHQREAFEFIWRNIAGGTNLHELISNETSDGGGGCLISHAPGTGKTRLSIAFLESYMKLYKNSRPVILAPASILLTWKKEFEKWKVGIPFQNLIDDDLSKDEIAMASSLFGIPNPKLLNTTAKRLIKLLFWKKHESVLAISYSLFSKLASEESAKKQVGSKKRESEKFRRMLLDLPGLLILDEGHMPRNERSHIFKVLSEVKTKKRFILSGTPFQNNFRELQNILCLVRPEEFSKRWEKNPFKRSVEKAEEDKIKELKAEMEPFYHCYDGSIVDEMVPGLNDNIVFLEPSMVQLKLLQEAKKLKNHLEANAQTALISTHPRLLRCKDEKTNPDFAEELKNGKWDLCDGAKARFLMRFIELSSALGESVLVFSEYLQPLNFVKALLESSSFFGWKEGREILFMSGQQEMETRKRNMDLFNKPGSEAKVMLASIKAASEGIELTGASRVVLLDVTWNPAVERQAISRAYRIGQERVVHVYHLLMTDHDSNRHTSQTHKNKCSEYVFSSSSRKNGGNGSSKRAFEDIILDRLLEEKVVKEAVQRKVCEPSS